jgi:hypothetical protein
MKTVSSKSGIKQRHHQLATYYDKNLINMFEGELVTDKKN